MGSQADDKNTDKCPFAGQARAYTNRDWWPNQLNLQVLHQHSALSNPMGEAFPLRFISFFALPLSWDVAFKES
jgi:catalase-peroxidase